MQCSPHSRGATSSLRRFLSPDSDVTNRVHGIHSSARIVLLLLQGHAVEETYGDIYVHHRMPRPAHRLARCNLSRYCVLASSVVYYVCITLTPDPLSWLRVGCRNIGPPKSRCSCIDTLCCLLDGRRAPEDGDSLNGPRRANENPLPSKKLPGIHFQETNEEPRFFFRHAVYSVLTVHHHQVRD